MGKFTFQSLSLGEVAPPGSISVDGLVPGAELDLSHWAKNRTPEAYRADTSTEIALRFVASPDAKLVRQKLVVNNHFDTDGALAIWTLLEPEAALARREVLIAAAEAGDFQEWPKDRRGILLDAAIQALGNEGKSDLSAYRRVLGQLPRLIDDLPQRRELWAPVVQRLELDLKRVQEGRIISSRYGRIGVARHAPAESEIAGPVLARLFLPRSWRYLLAFEQPSGLWRYRYERPRYAWAVTVQRVPLDPPDAKQLCQALGPGFRPSSARPGETAILESTEPLPLTPEVMLARLAQADPIVRLGDPALTK